MVYERCLTATPSLTVGAWDASVAPCYDPQSRTLATSPDRKGGGWPLVRKYRYASAFVRYTDSMCGIAGFVSMEPKVSGRGILERM